MTVGTTLMHQKGTVVWKNHQHVFRQTSLCDPLHHAKYLRQVDTVLLRKQSVFNKKYILCHILVDPIEVSFDVCDVNKDGLTMDEVQEVDCLATLQNLFGITNVTEAFLEIDTNEDNIITKKEGHDAATRNFDRKDCDADCVEKSKKI